MTQKNTVLLGLSGVLLGAGAVQLVAPRRVRELSALDFGGDLFIRGLGSRDLILGSGLWLTRQHPQTNKLWLQIFSGFMVFDTLLCLLALRKKNANFVTWLATLNSIIFAIIGFWSVANQKVEK